MEEPIQKFLSYALTYFGRGRNLPITSDSRLGEYRVDYTMPSREELREVGPKLEELYANSKTISMKD
jgi:hypothetical protein